MAIVFERLFYFYLFGSSLVFMFWLFQYAYHGMEKMKTAFEFVIENTEARDTNDIMMALLFTILLSWLTILVLIYHASMKF